MKSAQLLPDVERIVREAGSLLMDYFQNSSLVSQAKQRAGDVVTQADLASEQLLIRELQALVPEAAIFAEESGRHSASTKSRLCWVIDPLDGTVNFAHGIRYFCISVALTDNGVPVLACIYCPPTDEMFCARSSGGATCNGVSITVSQVATLDSAFVGVCLPYGRGEHFAHAIQTFERLALSTGAVRKWGAAALDQAYVALGRLDAVLFEDLAWWDVAAGSLLVKEAGGRVTDYQEQEVRSDYMTFIASNGLLHRQLLDIV